MIKRIITALVLTGFVFVLYSCGQGSDSLSPESVVPAGSTITISPDTVTVSDSGTRAWHRQDFVITAKNANGIPLNNVRLYISYSWAVPDSKGYVQLYDGSTPVNSPMTVTTDENGTYILRFDFQSGGLEYSADLAVSSGSSSASAEFKVDTGA